MGIQDSNFRLAVKALIVHQHKILILKDSELSRVPFWDLPGGGISIGEDPIDGLRREVQEEAGIDKLENIQFLYGCISNLAYTIYKDSPSVFFIYSCSTPEHPEIKISDEHVDFKWADISEASEMLKDIFPQDFIEKLQTL